MSAPASSQYQMLEPALEPRRMSAADWNGVERGYMHSFRDCRQPSLWDWRFMRKNIDAQNWSGWVAPAPDGSIAAFVGGSRHCGWVYDHEASFVILRDNFSHPRWRTLALGRRGLFARTERAFLDDCSRDTAIAIGFGLDRRIKLGNLLGINSAYTSGQWFSASLSDASPPEGCRCIATLCDFSRVEPELDWDALWEKRKKRVRMGLKRDRSFLSWRFDDRQGLLYWRFALLDISDPIPLGYLVLTPAGPAKAILVDSSLPDNLQAVRDSWLLIAFWLSAHGIRQVDTFSGPGCPEHALWPLIGFRPCPSPMPVTAAFRIYDTTVSYNAFEQDYAFTLADCDLY